MIEKSVREWSVPVTLIESGTEKRAAYQACDAALAASGTITTELAAARTPMVVGYRMAPLTMAIARRLVRVLHVTLVNLVLGKNAIPEFIQESCTAVSLAEAVRQLLIDPATRELPIASLDEAVQALNGGAFDTSHRAAEVVQKAIIKNEVRRGQSRR